jgi:hypothetical protein
MLYGRWKKHPNPPERNSIRNFNMNGFFNGFFEKTSMPTYVRTRNRSRKSEISILYTHTRAHDDMHDIFLYTKPETKTICTDPEKYAAA